MRAHGVTRVEVVTFTGVHNFLLSMTNRPALAFKTLIQFVAADQKSHLHSLGIQHDGVRFAPLLQRGSANLHLLSLNGP
jgi:hypothetical protein